MTIELTVTNNDKMRVTLDKHVYEELLQDEHLTEIKLLANLRRHSNGYAFFQRYVPIDGKQAYETIYLHKLIAERYIKQPKTDRTLFVRFIDGNVHNLVLSNLEWVTMNVLRRQMRGGSPTTGYRGVTPDRGRFRAVLFEGKNKHDLGFFDSADDAARAYNKKSRELFGETLSLNVIRKED